jgi:hypothetical protein
MALLTRYWFAFRKSAMPTMLSLGCGVTAYDLADAQKMLQEQVYPMYGEQPIESIIENVDVSTLEEKHVRPNMGNPVMRGVWFPMLF